MNLTSATFGELAQPYCMRRLLPNFGAEDVVEGNVKVELVVILILRGRCNGSVS